MSSRSSQLAEAVALVLILAGAAWLRLGATHFIASDELRWLCRSSNFHRALVNQQWDDTFQVGHPGVITMWLGTLALPREAIGAWWDRFPDTAGCTDLTKFDDVGQEGQMQSLAPLLFAARRGVQLGTVVCLAALYYLLRRWHRLNVWMALTGLAFLALDPFLLAHSQVLHLDAMVSLLSLLAVVALAAVRPPATLKPRPSAPTAGGGEDAEYSEAPPWPAAPAAWPSADDQGKSVAWRRPLVAGAFAGLAMLAKASALLLLPFFVLYLAWHAWQSRDWRWAVRTGLLWAAGAAGAFVVLWPAMWVHPVQTVIRMLAKVEEEGGNPHEAGNFFMGRPVEDPGWWFYPQVLTERLPHGFGLLMLMGIFAHLYRDLKTDKREQDDAVPEWDSGNTFRVTVLLGCWMLFFGLIISGEPKKFDRYLLPTIVALVVGGGIWTTFWLQVGVWGLGRLVFHPEDTSLAANWREKLLATAFFGGILVLFLEPSFGFILKPDLRRYPLAAYVDDLGRAKTTHTDRYFDAVEHRILVGWGEGYDLAADFLNQLPGAEKMEVTVRGVSNFAPLFKGRTRSADGYRPGTSDFVVFYISQVQRRQNPDLLATYMDKHTVEPAYTGTINGIDYVWVYRNITLAPLREEIFRRAGRSDVIVAGGETVFARDFAGPQPLVRYWGHWKTAEMQESLAKDFPAGWRTAWVVRYPGFDPPVALDELAKVAARGETLALADGAVELTRFDRR